jgi:hypothetical protein
MKTFVQGAENEQTLEKMTQKCGAAACLFAVQTKPQQQHLGGAKKDALDVKFYSLFIAVECLP